MGISSPGLADMNHSALAAFFNFLAMKEAARAGHAANAVACCSQGLDTKKPPFRGGFLSSSWDDITVIRNNY